MAITKKPKAREAEASSNIDIDALINKGGSVGGSIDRSTPAPSNKPVSVVLRIPPDALAKVDQSVEGRRVKVPRHTWLIEAIYEKLERED